MTLKNSYCQMFHTTWLTADSTGLSPREDGADPRSSCSLGLFCFDLFFFFLGGSLSLDTRLSDSLARAFNSGDWASLTGRLSSPSLWYPVVGTGDDLSPLELAPKYFRFRGLPGPLLIGVDLPVPSSALWMRQTIQDNKLMPRSKQNNLGYQSPYYRSVNLAPHLSK